MIRNINKLIKIDNDIQRLMHIKALLEWDQETFLPKRGAEERAEQIAMLEGLIHDKVTAPELGEYLEKLGASRRNPSGSTQTSEIYKGLIRALYRRYIRNHKIPNKLVVELAKQTSLAQSKWVNARKISDFSLFKPHLEILIKLLREQAECIGYEENIYDALLDEYEPGMKTSDLDRIFSTIREPLVKLFHRITSSGKKIDRSFLGGPFDIAEQEAFGINIAKKMGYDFERGRLDTSTHPFTITNGYSDVRITTRYEKNNLLPGLFGIIHECGHGLYELGFSKEIRNTLLADGASMGIHESQSRLWENLVGRSLPFWKAFFPYLKTTFPGPLKNTKLGNFYKAVNVVEPSNIRVEADEVSYNLHILLRYNLEKHLISGDLAAEDLPEAWNLESQKLLGITPQNDSLGVLQDTHWACGAFGYFPTYTLGNLYSAQFYDTMKKNIPGMEAEIEKGNLFAVFNWLRDKIHYHGSVFTPDELCRKVCGEPLKPAYFLDYLEKKYTEIYEL